MAWATHQDPAEALVLLARRQGMSEGGLHLHLVATVSVLPPQIMNLSLSRFVSTTYNLRPSEAKNT